MLSSAFYLLRRLGTADALGAGSSSANLSRSRCPARLAGRSIACLAAASTRRAVVRSLYTGAYTGHVAESESSRTLIVTRSLRACFRQASGASAGGLSRIARRQQVWRSTR